MVLLVPFFLADAEQGYYYTFASLLALQIFFDLGMNQVILQLVVAINHADAQSTDTLYARLDELGSQLRPLLDRLGLTKCTEKV